MNDTPNSLGPISPVGFPGLPRQPGPDDSGAAGVPTPPLTADEIRNKIVETFKRFEPHAQAYHDYAEQVAALSVAYHDQRLSEVLDIPMEEGVLVTTLNAAETPKSLDTKLAQIKTLPGTTIKRVLFDRTKGCYYLFA
jgi:hypothetical protein